MIFASIFKETELSFFKTSSLGEYAGLIELIGIVPFTHAFLEASYKVGIIIS